MGIPEDNLRKIRLEKLEKLVKKGINPYPAKYSREPIDDVCRKKIGTSVQIAGRIMALRGHGKMSFVDLVDGSGRIQVGFKFDELGEEKYSLLELLDLGDFLGVKGELFKTQAGELTVLAKDFTVLTKSLLSLPSTWYGLKDVEERYRKRYLDLLMNPGVKKVFETRTKIIAAIRQFLNERGFLEVETPTLQPLYGGANARPFNTHHNTLDLELYLKISDELYLKRLLIGGFDKVYEIDKDFRNEGMDKNHNPEFTMMECYWAYADYNDMMKLTEEMCEFVARKVVGETKITYQGQEIELKAPWKRITMKDALKEYEDIDVDKLSDKELLEEIKKHNLVYEGEPTLTGVAKSFKRGIAIATLFEIVEPKLIEPTFITDFPKETTALCKQKAGSPEIIERFEPYICGREIGNAYSELNNPLVQKEFFQEQVEAKKSGDEEAHPMDEDFLEALEYGMPPTGGLGIGVDRIVMFLTDQSTIRDVILFPTMRPEK
ncbi:lysine--tRNA ligase [Candidatus Shapirobacteria bacterium CG07_land_8_20_14_0_80_39_18]|uniref:Lysine--tRNA ligase n=1 Tax=Candidatus Shapirobacteria bacterium CG07_land_8_20_14_0_80_39_18 TaxID=1974882 RepID=A0A2M6YRP1_9BACT|nr:MAG: lysine--tRNA ligase [Candidatus Shapirobacteria bacterium CG07_land_8_20_14_0_80_39_18]